MGANGQSAAPLRLLVVAAGSPLESPLATALRRGGAEIRMPRTEDEYCALLGPHLDAVICASGVPGFDAAKVLGAMEERLLDLPFIIVSPPEDDTGAHQLIAAGATDYVRSDQLACLPRVIQHALERRAFRRERQAAEKALAALQTQHSLILNAIGDGVHRLDLEGNILFENPAGAKMLGWQPLDLVGRSAHQVIHRSHPGNGNHSAEDCPMYATLRSGQIRAARKETFWRKDGTSFQAEYISAPVRDHAGQLLGSVVTFRDVSQRVMAEQELRRSELLLREVTDAMPQIVWASGADGRLDYFNYQALVYSGRSHEELVERGWRGLVHAKDLERTRRRWRHAIETGSNYEIEYRLKRASDGSYRWHLGRALPVRDANGIIVRWFGTCTDIDDQKKAQETLRRSEENLAIAQRVAQTGSWEMPLHADVEEAERALAWSDETFRIFGLAPGAEKITQGRFFEFVPPGERPAILAAVEQMLTTDQLSHEHRIILRDGTERVVHEQARLIRGADGTPRKVIGTVQDITERRQAEHLLRQQAEMLNLAHDAIMVRDFDSEELLFWNNGAERLYGWTSAEALRRTFREVTQVDPEVLAAARATLLSSGEFRREVEHTTKDGRGIIVNVRSTLVRDADGRPRSVLSINTDVTEHKKLEGQFLRAQRLESIGTLASGVAHDLNNILAPILMSAPLLREDLPPEISERIITTIEESAQRGAQIVKQVLTFARGVEGDRVLIDPTYLVKEMVQIAGETFPKSIGITARYSDNVWPVEGDPTQLHQVILNLSVNARDAMPSGGSLVLSVENFTVDEHYASMMQGAKAGPHVLIRATDTGSGIPRDLLDKIFDPFFTTKGVGKGTGLGLSTALGIVKSHGGFLSVQSELGSGTTFTIFLPAAAATRTDVSPVVEPPPIRGSGETILVVDDEASIATITKLILENHNYRVLTAHDGPEALALFAQHMDGVDLVITDMMMPYMDGAALIRTLQRMSARVRFIASTGHGDQPRDVELQGLGVTATLTKPYDVARLLTTVQQLLGTRNGA